MKILFFKKKSESEYQQFRSNKLNAARILEPDNYVIRIAFKGLGFGGYFYASIDIFPGQSWGYQIEQIWSGEYEIRLENFSTGLVTTHYAYEGWERVPDEIISTDGGDIEWILEALDADGNLIWEFKSDEEIDWELKDDKQCPPNTCQCDCDPQWICCYNPATGKLIERIRK